jgi:hypothetical protein
MAEVEDADTLGRILMEGLSRRLGDPEEGIPDMREDPTLVRPRPEILGALETLPEGPGVYLFRDGGGKPLYVGKAKSLRVRAPQHFDPLAAETEKGRELSREARQLTWEETGGELEALLVEQMSLRSLHPTYNRQRNVHRRPRGELREETLLLALPSREAGRVEVCLVSGDGRFHWESVARRRRVPHPFWNRVKRFLAGESPGWAPGARGEPLTAETAAALAEITLSWLAQHGDRVTRIDLLREGRGRPLRDRIRRLLAENPRGERVEVR